MSRNLLGLKKQKRMVVPSLATYDQFRLLTSALQYESPREDYVTLWMSFVDPSQQLAYNLYNFLCYPTSGVRLSKLMVAAFYLPHWILYGIKLIPRISTFHDSDFISWVMTIVLLITAIGLLRRAQVHRRAILKQYELIAPENQRRKAYLFVWIGFFILTLVSSYHVIAHALQTVCNGNPDNKKDCLWTFLGSHQTDSIMLPSINFVVCMSAPFVFILLVQGSQILHAALLLVMPIVALLVVATYATPLAEPWLLAISYIVFAFIFVVEAKKHSYNIFFHHLQVQEASQQQQKEKVEAVDEAHIVETKNIVANIAHDLKTPLASFVSTIEFMQQTLSEFSNKPMYQQFKERSEKDPSSSGLLTDFVDSVSTCLTNMSTTNDFMLMTINRIQDYSKASKGMKLVPKYETIHLAESLSLPLRCIKEIQSRISIKLAPVSDEICKHIITDKQWLQENLLCLLSNAVKYSYSGEVTIKVTPVITTDAVEEGDEDEANEGTSRQAVSDIDMSLCSREGVRPTSTTDYEAEPSLRPVRSDSSLMEVACRIKFIRVEVWDEGIGLSDEAMENLFSPFKQAQKLAGGTGLGLFSLAKRIEALRGKCGVARRADGKQGSVFWFTFPYRADLTVTNSHSSSSFILPKSMHAKGFPSFMGSSLPSKRRQADNGSVADGTRAGVPASASIDESVGSLTRFLARRFRGSAEFDQSSMSGSVATLGSLNAPSGLEILLVDDTPSIVKITTMQLKKQRHSVLTCVNGVEAVKAVMDRYTDGGKLFDVVLMDLQMPIMDGLEAIRRIRAYESTDASASNAALSRAASGLSVGRPDEGLIFSANATSNSDGMPNSRRTPIIALSANNDEETERTALSIGADAYLVKPFNLKSFEKTLQKLNVLPRQTTDCLPTTIESNVALIL